jgi:hypothetical protein
VLDKRAVESQAEGVEIQAEHFEPCHGAAPRASSLVFKVRTSRDTTLFERGAALSNVASGPRSRRVLPPAR